MSDFNIPPSFPGRPRTQPPGVSGQPRSAPPDFTPELPESEQQRLGGRGPAEFGPQFGPQLGPQFRRGWQSRPWEFRRCLNRFTFIWTDYDNFWYYPVFVRGQFVEGFRWRRNRWTYERLNLRRVYFYRCF